MGHEYYNVFCKMNDCLRLLGRHTDIIQDGQRANGTRRNVMSPLKEAGLALKLKKSTFFAGK